METRSLPDDTQFDVNSQAAAIKNQNSILPEKICVKVRVKFQKLIFGGWNKFFMQEYEQMPF